MHPHADPGWSQIRLQIHDHLKTLFDVEDSSGIELFIMLQRVAHLSRLLDDQLGGDDGLSGPRWRLLLRLRVEEEFGDSAGVTPTVLSRSQRVSKNTISALLRGLEAQGLIQRALDPADLRAFRIQLTPAGRAHLHNATPRRVAGLRQLLAALTLQEQEQLTALLEKLQRALLEQYHPIAGDSDIVPDFPDQECTRP